MGVIPIAREFLSKSSLAFDDIFSFKTDNKFFIPDFSLIKCNRLGLNYGGCSSVVEYETVALGTWVRFPAFACLRKGGKK